jgi:hypothetical protein
MQAPAPEIIAAMKAVTEIRSDRRRSLKQRIALIGTPVAIAAATMIASNRSPVRTDQVNVTLLYIGADDCAPCRAWRGGEGTAFLGSAEFVRITYREVRSQHLDDLLKDENWPEDIRDYRSRIRRSDGVPLWLVIADRAVVEHQFGTAAWQERILPTIRSYLR